MSYFGSRRSAVVACNGMVTTSQPLAAQAGLRVLQQGGHAVDAAVATAAVLAVVDPGSTGIGGDMFALVWNAADRTVTALNGSGRSAAAANAEELGAQGFDFIPNAGRGGHFSVSVPGAVDGWHTLIDRYGRRSLADALSSAIEYALNGYPVSEVIARGWQESADKLRYRPSGREMLPGGRAPQVGEVVRLETLGRSLQAIAEGGVDAFYRGDIARRIARFIQSEGGWLTEDDLAQHHSDWDEPCCTDYRGVTVWECPPNGQGIAALEALNIVEGFDLRSMGSQSLDAYHYQIEAMRCGFADALRYVADPRKVEIPIAAVLSKDYARERRAGISATQASPGVGYGLPFAAAADTVYLSVVDGDGNACSFINSLFHNFGCGLVVPETGITLQNRGSLFSLDPEHPNFIAGSQRPYQTIIPAMATRGDEFWLSFGVMGGFQQPQGHLQVIVNMVDYGMNPQVALDTPRFKIGVPVDDRVLVEEDLDRRIIEGLRARGHQIDVISGPARVTFGGGQVIARDRATGVLTAGSEPRKDGAAVGW